MSGSYSDLRDEPGRFQTTDRLSLPYGRAVRGWPTAACCPALGFRDVCVRSQSEYTVSTVQRFRRLWPWTRTFGRLRIFRRRSGCFANRAARLSPFECCWWLVAGFENWKTKQFLIHDNIEELVWSRHPDIQNLYNIVELNNFRCELLGFYCKSDNESDRNVSRQKSWGITAIEITIEQGDCLVQCRVANLIKLNLLTNM